MERKVGILTWHYYPNFGSALQAYALQKTISQQGYDVELVNYRLKKYKTSSLKDKIKARTLILCDLISPTKANKLGWRFVAFQETYLRQSRRVYTETETKSLCRRYNIIVCGSDQIWAPNVFNPIYMLSIVDDDRKKIAYAPSIGLNYIPDSLVDKYKYYLNRIDYISVREESGGELLRKEFDIFAETVLDPTLLLKREEWEKLSVKPTESNYVFCYFLNKEHQYKDYVLNIAHKYHAKIVTVSSNIEDKQWSNVFLNNGFEVGPREFIGYISEALFIITDSFHGTAFSILFEKQFVTLARFRNDDVINQNSRIINLLGKIDHIGQWVTDYTTKDSVATVDYSVVNKRLQKERESSMRFLTNSLRA